MSSTALRRRLTAMAAVAGILLGLLCTEAPSMAGPTLELSLLGQIPSTVLDRITSDAQPDQNGMMQLNQAHWTSVVFQRVAMPLMWVGAVESNRSKVDASWKAVDAAFAHQLPDGSFATADGSQMSTSDMSFWLEALCHGILVLQQSSLGADYSSRIGALLPKIEAATSWLAEPQHTQNLLHGDNLGTNRIFVDAFAFDSAALLLKSTRFHQLAHAFLSEALTRQTPDGISLENGGFDSSYQAVSLLHASYFQLYSPSPELRTTLDRMLTRELKAVNVATGAVSAVGNTRAGDNKEFVYGHPKALDYRSIILGLYYSGLLLQRTDGVAAAAAVFTHVYHQNPNL